MLSGILGAASGAVAEDDRAEARARMVQEQIAARGLTDARVLAAMREVPRHRFVPESRRDEAYEDRALPIGHGATISQPYVVAYMTQAAGLGPDDRVLEVGTGSGYQAAILSRIAKQVYTIEIVPELAERARRTLAETGYDDVVVVTGDGYAGLPEHAPFDAILVTAAPPAVPPRLVEQLAEGGRMVLPVGRFFQKLRIVERTSDGVREEDLIGVRFLRMKRGSDTR